MIRAKQLSIDKEHGAGSRNDLVILINPTKDSSYQNLINTLDEIMTSAVKKYAITEPAKEELLYLEKTGSLIFKDQQTISVDCFPEPGVGSL